MISSEALGMFLILIAMFGLCIVGYIYEYSKYVWRYYPKYGTKAFRRGLRYLRRL